MLKDLKNREDIDRMLIAFYSKVKVDELLGFIFKNVAKVNWEQHLPVIADFWEGVIFNKNVYKGNPMQVHLHLNSLVKLEKNHFDRWLKLFEETATELFDGPNKELMLQRAISIATVIRIKISEVDKTADK